MGRFDEDPRKKSLNEKIEKGIIKANNFMMNPPNQFLKYFFFIITLPNRLVYQNNICSKFVQKHMIIITPLQYSMVLVVLVFSAIFIPGLYLETSESKILFCAGLYAVMLFFAMATFRGGGKRKDDKPPTDNSEDKITVNCGV